MTFSESWKHHYPSFGVSPVFTECLPLEMGNPSLGADRGKAFGSWWPGLCPDQPAALDSLQTLAIDLLLCVSWLDHPVTLLYKGHGRIEISFAWKQMPIKITGEGQKGSKKHLIGVVDPGRMLNMVPIFPKAFCSSVSQAASSMKFFLCMCRQKHGGRS